MKSVVHAKKLEVTDLAFGRNAVHPVSGIALGNGAGNSTVASTGGNVFLGTNAGAAVGQPGIGSVCIGLNTGAAAPVGDYSVSVGAAAVAATDNSIVLNAAGTPLTSTESSLFVKPIRELAAGGPLRSLWYNPATGEITYTTF
jgi:hypothetical protein